MYGAAPAGNDNSKKERWLILLTKLSNNGIINYEKKKRGKV